MSETYTAGYSSSEIAAMDTGSASVDYGAQSEQTGELIRNETAAFLASKQDQTVQAGSSENYELEAELSSVQKELFQLEKNGINDPLKAAALQAKAEKIAGQLVGASASDQVDQETFEEQEDLTDYLKNEYPDHDVYLANASKVLGNERSAQFNSLLESGDEAQSRAAMETLKTLNESPQYFSAASTNATLNSDQMSWATETFGEDIAGSIRTLSDVVNSGQVSAADAIATASKDPKVLSALLIGARQGMWTLAL